MADSVPFPRSLPISGIPKHTVRIARAHGMLRRSRRLTSVGIPTPQPREAAGLHKWISSCRKPTKATVKQTSRTPALHSLSANMRRRMGTSGTYCRESSVASSEITTWSDANSASILAYWQELKYRRLTSELAIQSLYDTLKYRPAHRDCLSSRDFISTPPITPSPLLSHHMFTS